VQHRAAPACGRIPDEPSFRRKPDRHHDRRLPSATSALAHHQPHPQPSHEPEPQRQGALATGESVFSVPARSPALLLAFAAWGFPQGTRAMECCITDGMMPGQLLHRFPLSRGGESRVKRARRTAVRLMPNTIRWLTAYSGGARYTSGVEALGAWLLGSGLVPVLAAEAVLESAVFSGKGPYDIRRHFTGLHPEFQVQASPPVLLSWRSRTIAFGPILMP
jgi:hypothetical protein